MDNGVVSFLAAAAASDGEDIDAMSISDQELEQVLTASVQLYAKRAEATGVYPPPLSANRATATSVLTTVSEMLRVVDVNLFDLSLWYNRPK